MTNTLRMQARRAGVGRRLDRWAGVGVFVALAVGAAHGSVPTSNELGVRFKVLKSGPTTTVEIRMTPRRDFDAVAVEAASGVASLAPSCGFANVRLVAGGTYACRVEVTGKASEAAMTLNVVGRRALSGGSVPVTEVHHFSVKNTGFALAQKSIAESHHNVADSSAINK